DFTLADLEQQLEYFIGLGVKTIYASPIFTAVPGSTHGYDALNPLEINPEVGTIDQLRTISARLREAGIGWLQDIVPNHMAFDTRNPWLRDVLEKGRQSVYAAFFDITWNDAVASGHIMAPFLGKSLQDAVRDGEVQVGFDSGRFTLNYNESSYPLRLRSYQQLLAPVETNDAMRQWLLQAEDLQGIEEPNQFSSAFEELIGQLHSLSKDDSTGRALEDAVASLNRNKEALLALANDQVYRLCHWQETDGQINYRRFFTVNGLICLNMQDEAVFGHFHQLVQQLVQEGVFQGVRVDHVDGLYDPGAYLRRLRALLGADCYIVVEKILALQEPMPLDWPIEGATGYEFLAQVNQALTDPRGEEAFTRFYYGLAHENRTVPQQVRDKKAHILYRHMGGELENLYQLLLQQLAPEEYAQMRTEDLKTAIAELLFHMPVYRYYGNALPLPETEKEGLSDVFLQARTSRPDIAPALGLLEHTLTRTDGDDGQQAKQIHLYKRLMQLSGPLMAKGVEDTLMYTFFRFIGHNEVGDAPGQWSWNPAELHYALRERQAEWPLALNATSTHDTKRGEDVRARLQALSSLPSEWMALVQEWLSTISEERPDKNDVYLLLQTLIAAAPFDEEEDWSERLEAYLEKALRESKRRSDWAHPDSDYEAAAKELARRLSAPGSSFRKSAEALQQRVEEFGMLNSFVQVLLKCTAPGTPDIYQGCEGWDLSLVDPDNRRPVDYERCKARLQECSSDDPDLIGKLWEQRRDGRFKFWLTRTLLRLRAASPALFAQGDYIPVTLEGSQKDHVFAFARRQGERVLLVAVPIHSAGLAETVEAISWEDTRLELPAGLGSSWKNLLSGGVLEESRQLLLDKLFSPIPLLVLEGTSVEIRKRGSGLLLHLSSLPAPFGIGDMGPEAYRFANFLAASRQRYWQLLPLNPTEAGQGHSPYSSTSSFAGNRLLISPELLVEEGLLTKDECGAHYQPQLGKTDYEAAQHSKDELLDRAWERFQDKEDGPFAQFCREQKAWLDDFARYCILKKKNGGKPWYEWEDNFKLRDGAALAQLDIDEADPLQRVRWEQFLFERQWHKLKDFCNERSIRLIGDLPFYVSYDSADVWSNRELFRLDDAGNRLGLAGVPPDAFSADGQLWGMPVYDWSKMKEQDYSWWAQRLRRNMDLFDLVRLDHFRAFAAYWEVPAGAETARDGQWVEGPGTEFLERIQMQLGSLPFVAEDLGDIDDAVLSLRDRFRLPGMKVLQFAFGEDIATSPHIPHSYENRFLAYTGTHDNNTTRGWYRHECDEATRRRLWAYAGRKLTEDEVPHYLCRLALSSVAETAIIPVQDLLGLDELGRMNTPASAENNWGWRLLPGQLTKDARRTLRQWTELFGRG
ncbi:MAG: malto-oligosyltrehalose synthase, partial [Chitinophagaceae bacterium]